MVTKTRRHCNPPEIIFLGSIAKINFFKNLKRKKSGKNTLNDGANSSLPLTLRLALI